MPINQKPRLRDLGPTIGYLPPGPLNALTDVPGVWVGHTTLIADTPRVARTGVTVILPHEGRIWKEPAFAAYHSYNGCGEMTGTHWIAESGMLTSPIAITNTGQVGTVHEALGKYAVEHGLTEDFELPVVAETYDGWLNDIAALHLTREHVFQAMDAARSGPVVEGCVGGGTGMICHEFKGGIGTSSRVVEISAGRYTVGALVQANYGVRRDLRLDGVPVGVELGLEQIPSGWAEAPGVEPGAGARSEAGSIIVIVATDAPLLPFQCKRLAQRATTGLARTGGFGNNGSGDIFLAFATGNTFDPATNQLIPLHMLANSQMNPFFVATAEAVEEAIWNALIAAETTTGYKGRTAYAIPHEEVVRIWKKYRP
ncbi:MAG TPA: P1 family peptidase [Anaerolineales bacterium]|nr:P1 family peptidase [Anaerolineales bacterium]